MPALPPVPPLDVVRERLKLIFPNGMSQRNYFVRDIAAKTVFVMLYAGAVEGLRRWVRPNQVTRMSDAQAALVSEADREAWGTASLRPQRTATPGQWFATDTREPIRDETLKNAFREVGAVVERADLSTTSSTPRWALAAPFAELFTCPELQLPGLISAWRAAHLSPQALARTALAHGGVAASSADAALLVQFPNGETRRMSTGLSSAITKAVVEQFASRFLADPGVLWISESRTQVVARDDALARRVGLDINRQEVLPDVILVDLSVPSPPLFVFVEVVASDGPVSEARRRALLDLVIAGGHDASNAAFVTAFWDRERPEYRKVVGAIAWDTLVWSASEPDKIIIHRDTSERTVRVPELLPTAER
jgi:BsuBI/PstI restriction endonuclease domain/BsuBI/PstI restriction endonuclease HTH domain